MNFCTLFDSYYLTRGIAMYESLLKHSSDFHLYIFAFDDASCKYLKHNNLEHATVISLKEFETDELLEVKKDRSKGEYCWTCTSSTILYCLDTYGLDNCTYLDADLYFFSDPKILLKEVSNGDTLITDHRYSWIYDQGKTSGKYCVQFITFHNNKESRKVLKWWTQSCIDWCYARAEEGKFGDQKYLESFRNISKNIHDLEHLGGGVAPWNVQQYDLFKKNDRIYGYEKKSNKEFELIFYHFHSLKFLDNDQIELSLYELDDSDIELIYKPYLKHINEINKRLKGDHDNFIIKDQSKVSFSNYTLKDILFRVLSDWKSILRYLKLRSKNYIVPMNEFIDN